MAVKSGHDCPVCPGSAENIRLVPVVAGARGVSHRRHGAAIPILKSATEGEKSTRKREEKVHANIGCKQSFMSDTPMMATPALLAPMVRMTGSQLRTREHNHIK